MSAVKFLLGHQLQEVAQCSPTLTLLDYLREHAGRKGSKEGCAEGDCGACTVVLVELDDERQLRYRAVNACILFLPAVNGKQVITVDDLGPAEGKLHPVQQALVDYHGSQCGFCTPGFVMSLFAMYHDPVWRQPSRTAVDQALAGNLCRCTGYAPIVRAAYAALEAPAADAFDQKAEQTRAQLLAIQPEATTQLQSHGQRYFAPCNRKQLCRLLQQHPQARIIAGATDVGLWVTKQLKNLETTLYIGQIPALRQIRETAEQLEIGAAVTYTDAMAAITSRYPAFESLLNRLGGLQVRNSGTVVGNIANGSPIGDMPPGLIALNASLLLHSNGGRRQIPLEDFFIAYGRQDLQSGEYVEKVIIPEPSPGQKFACYKLSRRRDQDISSVCGAFALTLENGSVAAARIAFGGMAATPKRALNCEQSLIQQPWSQDSIDEAKAALAEDFQPISDMRASAGYRMLAAQNMLQRFYLQHQPQPASFPTQLTAAEDSSREAG